MKHHQHEKFDLFYFFKNKKSNHQEIRNQKLAEVLPLASDVEFCGKWRMEETLRGRRTNTKSFKRGPSSRDLFSLEKKGSQIFQAFSETERRKTEKISLFSLHTPALSEILFWGFCFQIFGQKIYKAPYSSVVVQKCERRFLARTTIISCLVHLG